MIRDNDKPIGKMRKGNEKFREMVKRIDFIISNFCVERDEY